MIVTERYFAEGRGVDQVELTPKEAAQVLITYAAVVAQSYIGEPDVYETPVDLKQATLPELVEIEHAFWKEYRRLEGFFGPALEKAGY